MMKLRSKRGMTLMEMIPAVVLTAVIIAAAASVLYLGAHTYQTGTAGASNQQKGLLVESYLQKYASVTKKVSDHEVVDKCVVFSIANDTLTIQDHISSSSNKTLVTIDGIDQIQFSLNGNNLDYIIGFPDTEYTLHGGIVMNNSPTGSVSTISDKNSILSLTY
jgi:prepilin-type N-terminal cleavage/methylation domain-containing protein